jgi:hypothetical protein
VEGNTTKHIKSGGKGTEKGDYFVTLSFGQDRLHLENENK